MRLDFKPFRFWCQKVLPTVYDDSLSYYELLCKLVAKLDEVMQETSGAFNQLEENFESLKKEFEELRDSVEKFTSDIDFQKYVDNYINELLKDRDIDKLIADLLAKNYNTNFLDVADVEIFAQNMPEDGVVRSSQGMDIGVINNVPYMATALAGEYVNLIPFPYAYGDRTQNGITCTTSNGKIKLDGVLTRGFGYRLISTDNALSLPIGTYTLSGLPKNENRMQLRVYDWTSGEQKILASDLGGGVTFTIEETALIEIRLNLLDVGIETEFNGVIVEPMLEVGSVAHPATPYSENPIISQFTIYNMLTGENVYTLHDTYLGHMNDVCFCSEDKNWYITTDDVSRYYTRFNLETGALEHILCPIEDFEYIHGIAYNEKEKLFYVFAKFVDGFALCKVNFEMNEVLNKVKYSEPNYTHWKNQGIYFDGVYLYKLNSRTTRDSDYSVFNHIEVYDSDMVYVKTINAPYAYEIEGMSYYNGKYYLSYNCYSRCGLIFKGDLFSTNNSYHTRDAWVTPIGVERWRTQYTCYVGNYETAGFLCNNTKEHPFCHVWAGIGYLTDVNKTYATIELVSDVDCEFECYGQTFTNLHIIGNGFKWNGYVRVENVIDFHCENLTIVANNSWCLFIEGVPCATLTSVNCDTMGGDTAINCYDSNITFNGEYNNTATETFVNSNRLVHLRFNTMPTSGATTFGCSTYAMKVHDIKARAVSGNSLFDTTLDRSDDVKDIWRNGTFVIQSDNVPVNAYANRNAVIIATNIGGNSTKLEWYDRSRINTQTDIAIAYRVVDHVEGFDSGWIDIRRNYNMLSITNIDFYVDSETGNDLNPGTQDKPFATLTRFFDEYTKYAEIRCIFIGNGNDYTLSKYETLNNIGCHFYNRSNNTTINITWKGRYTPACYNCHFNIDGTVDKNFNIIIPNKLYFDGGFGLTASYATFTGNILGINGSYGNFEYCTFDDVQVGGFGGNISFRGCIFKGGKEDSCIYYYYGTVSVRTNIDVSEATPTLCIIKCVECDIHQDVVLRNTSIAGFNVQNCVINGSDTKLNSWDANGSVYYTTVLLGDTYRYKNNGV